MCENKNGCDQACFFVVLFCNKLSVKVTFSILGFPVANGYFSYFQMSCRMIFLITGVQKCCVLVNLFFLSDPSVCCLLPWCSKTSKKNHFLVSLAKLCECIDFFSVVRYACVLQCVFGPPALPKGSYKIRPSVRDVFFSGPTEHNFLIFLHKVKRP